MCNDLYLEAYKICNTNQSESESTSTSNKSNICGMICETAIESQNKTVLDEYIKKPELTKEQINKIKSMEKPNEIDLDNEKDEITEKLIEIENKKLEESLLQEKSFTSSPEKSLKKTQLLSRKESDEISKLKKRIMRLETDNRNYQRNTFQIDALLKELEEKKREIVYLRKLLDELREKEKMNKKEEETEIREKEDFDIVKFLQQNNNLTAEQKRLLLLRKRCYELYSIDIIYIYILCFIFFFFL